MAYKVDYSDKRFTDVEAERKTELTEAEKLYGGWADDVYEKYEGLADETQKWADEQTRLQNEQTDLALKEIEKNKAESKEDYIKEQSGAYVDWQKQSNKYGADAEKMASMGMAGTGFSESSQVGMYNQYQNRIAMARQSFERITADYNLSMDKARLQNSVALAEIAQKAQQQKLEYLLQGTMYKQEMLDKMVTQKNAINSRYDTKWKNVLDQINTEKSLELNEREVKLAEEKFEYEKEQDSTAKIVNTNTQKGNAAAIRTEKGVKSTKDDSYKIASSITTERGAREFLKSRGITNPSPRLLSSMEWNKAKKDGQLGSELEGIDSYAEYVQVYCSWAVNTYM